MVTTNRATLAISGTGSAGMEAMVVNFVAPGDRVVCGVNGLFGERMADELARNGAIVERIDGEWGRALDTQRLIDAVEGIERGEFPPTPEDVFLCGFCSYGAVCRKDYVGDV